VTEGRVRGSRDDPNHQWYPAPHLGGDRPAGFLSTPRPERMKPRRSALLIHGLGSRPGWWDPFLPGLRHLGIEPAAVVLPSLETAGPEAWVTCVRKRAKGTSLLLGHSLGAAVALEAAREVACDAVLLLAMPTLNRVVSPEPPRETGLSATALARVASFLRRVNESPPTLPMEVTHVVGAKDPHVMLWHARRLPYPLHVILGAGHDLSRSARVVERVLQQAARLEMLRSASGR
jgi:pimeloyl-ACP methyl ester carboxylesterase